MAVGTYNLPICDLCELPWLPVGWTQDSDPRNLREGAKPLRCGKCKSIGWDREFVKQQKVAVDVVQPSELNVDPAAEEISDCLTVYVETTEMAVNPFDPTEMIEMPRNVALNEALLKHNALKAVDEYLEKRGVTRIRCKHRMTDCPICHPKEAA